MNGLVTVVGSANMDLVVTTARLPQPGETVLGRDIRELPGGKGANQACAAARSGARVEFIGAVGDDPAGARIRDYLAEQSVGTAQLRTAVERTGTALISLDEAAENTIIVVPGANSDLRSLTAADRDLIRGSRFVLLQLEIRPDLVAEVIREAAEAQVPVVLNPSPVDGYDDATMQPLSYLIVNETEAAQLAETAVRRATHVITTLGARGARYQGPDGSAVSVAAPVVDAVDTTGAGDAFAGAFIAALARDESIQRALQYGCAAGALAATVHGAYRSAPARPEIEQLLAQTYR